MNFSQLRKKMVLEQLRARGIIDPRVLEVMGKVPREKFVLPENRSQAYWDGPLAIGRGQTISQPYVIALALQLLELKGNEKVLDIGAGSGYEAALLSFLAKEVISVEIIPQLAKRAGRLLRDYENVRVIIGDGRQGFPEEAPFEAIKAAAAAEKVPPAWKKQLKNGGRIVFPLKKTFGQELVRIIKKNNKFIQESFGSVFYVPLVSGN